MGLILPILLLGLLASISPVTLAVFLLLLATTRARLNAGAFLIGWTVSVTVVFALSYAIGSYHGVRSTHGGNVLAGIEVLLGAGLMVVGVWQWRRRNRPSSRTAVSPGLQERLKGLDPWGAAVLGVLKQPWSLTAAAALVLVHHHSAIVVALIAFLIFAAVSTASVGGIYIYYAREPDEADARLADLYARVVRLGPTLVAGLSFVIGLVLAFDGLSTLLG
jgi:hypothetical protein